MDISAKIKSIREEKSIKQRDIANQLGIDQSNYSRFEQRGDKLTIDQLQGICKVLGVTLEEFFSSDEGERTIKESKNDLIQKLEDKAKLVESLQKALTDVTFKNFEILHNISEMLDSGYDILLNEKLTTTKLSKLKTIIEKSRDLSHKRGMSSLEKHIEILKNLEAKSKTKKSTK